MKTYFYAIGICLGWVVPSEIEQRRMGVKLPN